MNILELEEALAASTLARVEAERERDRCRCALEWAARAMEWALADNAHDKTKPLRGSTIGELTRAIHLARAALGAEPDPATPGSPPATPKGEP